MLFKNYCNIPRTYGILQSFYVISRHYKTHYQVLNLPVDCTTNQIRQAFIQLSKEHHPDVNKSELSHAKFLQIIEAYQVLAKPDSRRNYDLGLAINKAPLEGNHVQYTRDPYSDPTFWNNRDRKGDAEFGNEPYYGVAGIKKLSNGSIAVFCVILALMGVGLQILAIRNSGTLDRDKLLRQAMQTEKEYNEFRDAALQHGNEAQVEALKIRFLQTNQPTNK